MSISSGSARTSTPRIYSAFLAGSLFLTNLAFAAPETVNPGTTIENKTTWESVKSRLRLRFQSEYMTPSFKNNGAYVPDDNGAKDELTFFNSTIWTDFEISNGYKLLYWQRSKMS